HERTGSLPIAIASELLQHPAAREPSGRSIASEPKPFRADRREMPQNGRPTPALKLPPLSPTPTLPRRSMTLSPSFILTPPRSSPPRTEPFGKSTALGACDPLGPTPAEA